MVDICTGKDNQTIVKADRPKELLRNSILTPSLAASIMNAKYVNGLPLYRISQEFLRNDIHISRQVMANRMIQCADRYLGPLYDYLHNKMYRFHVLQANETPVKVSKDGRPANSKGESSKSLPLSGIYPDRDEGSSGGYGLPFYGRTASLVRAAAGAKQKQQMCKPAVGNGGHKMSWYLWFTVYLLQNILYC